MEIVMIDRAAKEYVAGEKRQRARNIVRQQYKARHAGTHPRGKATPGEGGGGEEGG